MPLGDNKILRFNVKTKSKVVMIFTWTTWLNYRDVSETQLDLKWVESTLFDFAQLWKDFFSHIVSEVLVPRHLAPCISIDTTSIIHIHQTFKTKSQSQVSMRYSGRSSTLCRGAKISASQKTDLVLVCKSEYAPCTGASRFLSRNMHESRVSHTLEGLS